MPKLTESTFFGGTGERLNRLGLINVWKELENILTNFQLCLDKQKNKASEIVLRKFIAARFRSISGWKGKRSGGVHWTRCHHISEIRVCIGVQIQLSVSAESDLILVDLQFLRDAIAEGRIDVGVIVVPSDKLAYSLTDGVVRYSDAVRAVERAQASHLPLAVLALEHDGLVPSLIKAQPGHGKKRTAKRETSTMPAISDSPERWLGV
jgi:hypothetical protein